MDHHMTSSAIYLSLIMEKIFGGMAERISKEADKGGLTEQDIDNPNKMKEWMDADMDRCLTRKKDIMEMVLRGLKRSLENPDENKLTDKLYDVFLHTWMERIFTDKSQNMKLKHGSYTINVALAMIMGNEQSAFFKNLKQIITKVLQEDKNPENGSIRSI